MVSSNSINEDRGDHATCFICLSDYEGGEEKSCLNCSHIFHSDCLVDMRRHSAAAVANSCPLCRTRITSINEEPVEPIVEPVIIRARRIEEQIYEDEMLVLQFQNRWQMAPPPPADLPYAAQAAFVDRYWERDYPPRANAPSALEQAYALLAQQLLDQEYIIRRAMIFR